MENSREKILMRELFADHYKLLDRFEETVKEVGKISIVMSGTPGQRGLLGSLEVVSDSIKEASTGLAPIIGSALPQKVDSLIRQFDLVPHRVCKAADSLDFRMKVREVFAEEAKPAFDEARECASYSVSAHVHAEVGKSVAEAVNKHLAEPIMVTGRIGKLEGEIEALRGRLAAQAETIKGQKDAIKGLSSGKVNRVLLWFTFALGWGVAVFASTAWSFITHWVAQQPIPAWFLP